MYMLIIYFWLRWVFTAPCRLSLVVVIGSYSNCGAWASPSSGFSRCKAAALDAWASAVAAHGLSSWLGLLGTGAVVVAPRLRCREAGGIFPDQGSDPRPLHWQADFYPAGHQGSPIFC